jgi:hypothetical protein
MQKKAHKKQKKALKHKKAKKSFDNFCLTHYMMLKMCFLEVSGPSEAR